MAVSADNTHHGENEYWVSPARNFRTSARLRLQHFLTQNTLDCLLESPIHDHITNNGSKSLKVADLACGNGAWLIDLQSEMCRKGISAELDGFDVNTALFPHPDQLPGSVTLKQLDILKSPPNERTGLYDIVHIRYSVSLVIKSNVTPLLSTALAFLKPGGFIQWEEMRADSFLVESPSPLISKTACDTIAGEMAAGCKVHGLESGWVYKLDQHLSSHGFENVGMRTIQKRKQDMKGWTEDFLMVWEELDYAFPPSSKEPQATITRERFRDLFVQAVKETEQGVFIHEGNIMAAVGQKPE
ncbi:hypothetical protein F4821DRAFT_59737 [Hypoxylon rubiginosum]|uniref:Uncharacterized protein n=1 Tax=Hypoxylon rubiginosum TaxID=110542 RepID=A0ACC0CJ19_9PEZI|nr:hypothetical protein F4821DRAFT_59737 [Hypoxylon rubiginosum]